MLKNQVHVHIVLLIKHSHDIQSELSYNELVYNENKVGHIVVTTLS